MDNHLLRLTALVGLFFALAIALIAPRALAAPGDLDRSFAGDGLYELQTPLATQFDDVTTDARRRVVAVGTIGEGPAARLLVARLTPAGQPDPTFGGGDGFVALDDPPDSIDHGLKGARVVIQPDGKIVAAAGSAYADDAVWVIARFEENGDLDRSFGSGGEGYYARPVARHSEADVGGLLLDGDRIVVAGTVDDPYRVAVLRITEAGERDSTFRDGGFFTEQIGTSHSYATALVQDSQRRLVLVGSGVLSGTEHVAIVRYFRDGARDRSFGGGDGEVLPKFLPAPNESFPGSAIVKPDASIVAVAPAEVPGNRFNVGLAGLTGAGDDDQGFGTSGRLLFEFGQGGAMPHDIAALNDGKLMTVGETGIAADVLGISRHLPNGALDPAFGNGGKVVVPYPDADLSGSAVTIQRDGKALVAGSVYTFSGDRRGIIARVENDGSAAQDPAQGGQPAPTRSLADTKSPRLVARGGRIKVGRRGTLTLLVPCPADESSCAGTVSLTARVEKSLLARKQTVQLARKGFSASGGKTARVKLKLSRRNLRALRRAGRLSATLRLNGADAAGNKTSSRKSLSLIAPRKVR